MMVSAILKVMTLALLMTLCEGQSQDATRMPGAVGSRVVNTVIERIRSRCVFSEDRLFLRRTAYVMTRDGQDSLTYRPGFDGGIWQVNHSMLLATQSCNQPSLHGACSNITTELGIDWNQVQWSDLRKPLYSGLAAALYAKQILGYSEMPGNLSSQADLWAQMYGQASGDTFSTEAAQAPIFKCKDKLDLAFVLDSSGSVSYSDFQLMKDFTASVVDVMDVSQNAIRIADIIYANSVNVTFDFDDHPSKASVKAHLLNAVKIGGGTNTAAGLDMARQLIQSPGRGARTDVKKVTVLVTDGRSSSFINTQNMAKQLKDAGVTVFAVGVGNYNLRELQAVASEPICSHVLTLTGFDKIDSIITEIQKSACEANYKVAENTVVEGNIDEGGSEQTVTTPAPGRGNTTEAKVECGILHVYASLTDPKPGPTVFDQLYVASPDHPAVVRLVETLPEGSPVYITVQGTRLPASVAALRNCSDFKWSLGPAPKKNITVICEVNGQQHACTEQEISDGGLCPKGTDVTYPVDNPCTQNNLDSGITRFPYPYDPFKFLQCDKQGHYYITLCPGGIIFNAQIRECGFTSPGSFPPSGTKESNGGRNVSSGVSDGQQVQNPVQVTSAPVSGISSKCSSQSLSMNQYYHPYDSDKTKFVQCDAWGKAYVMTCAAGTEWSQSAYTCIDITPSAANSTASCVNNNLYPITCEPTKYHICDNGVLKIQTCSSGLIYDEQILQCNWPPVPGQITKPASCP